MKLFHYLFNNKIALKIDPFTELLLERLSIMETLAAIKFKTMPIEDCQRELLILDYLKSRCLNDGYSIKKTAITLNIFMENMRLAKCIQMACFNEWKTMSIEDVHTMGLASSQAIITTYLGTQPLLESIRNHINKITNLMFDALQMIRTTPKPDTIIEPLILCFPNINRQDIERSIASIMKNMAKLRIFDNSPKTVDMSSPDHRNSENFDQIMKCQQTLPVYKVPRKAQRRVGSR